MVGRGRQKFPAGLGLLPLRSHSPSDSAHACSELGGWGRAILGCLTACLWLSYRRVAFTGDMRCTFSGTLHLEKRGLCG